MPEGHAESTWGSPWNLAFEPVLEGGVELKQVEMMEVRALRKLTEVGNDSFYSGSFLTAEDCPLPG